MVVGTSCKKIHIRKKIRKKIREKIQEDTFNDPVSTPYGKANSSLRPDSFLKSLIILKIFTLAALVQKFVRMTSDFTKLFTGPGKNYIIPHGAGKILFNTEVPAEYSARDRRSRAENSSRGRGPEKIFRSKSGMIFTNMAPT